jgi:hypothetical protein
VTVESTVPPPAGPDPVLAICCSGGGIRSAAFSLGALQALSEVGLYQRAKFVTSVSGGGYIAGSFATVRAGTGGGITPGQCNNKDADYAYRPGSPEDRYLRTHTHYLAPDARVALRGVLALLFGLVMNLGLLLVWVFVGARLTGIAARLADVHFAHVAAGGPGLTGPWWWWAIGPATVGLGIAVGLSERLIDVYKRPAASRVDSLRSWSWGITLAGAALTAIMVAAPALAYGLQLLATKTGVLADLARLVQNIGFGGGDGATAAKGAGVAATLVAIVRQLLKSGFGSALTTPAAVAAGPITAEPKAGWMPRLRALLLPWLGSALVVLAVGLAALRWLSDAALDQSLRRELVMLAGALVVFLLIKLFSDINRSSLHVFYRERLASAFTVRRVWSETARRVVAEPVPYEQPAPLSDAAPDDGGPELIVCAAANVTDEHVPPGRGSVPFTFTATDLGVAWGTPVPAGASPEDPGVAPSGDRYRCDLATYTRMFGPRLATLPGAVAVSAAAVSPLMGKFTRPSVRLLLGVANVRLGLWLPNPAKMSPSGRGPLDGRGLLGRALWQLRQPGVRLLLSELMGRTHLNRRWLYVTDGGHYDNLGLVEALRRQPSHVIALDGSGDAVNTWSTLGNAVGLARTELGIEIEIDPTPMVHGDRLGPQDVTKPFVRGTIHYPADGGGHQTGTLWLLKLGVVDDEHSPWDVRAYARGHSTFPTDSTIRQFYGDQQFEAYRELGHTGARGLAGEVGAELDGAAAAPPPGSDSRDGSLITTG